ncbi:Ubiquinone/menaquinone biosynthesis C-methyltransferase UbiE [compost metagenome]
MDHRNYNLKEDIRDYWSRRAKTFDLAFGHRISPGPEFIAWGTMVRSVLGPESQKVLELACGTGEITRVLLSLGHAVTAVDFSETMLETAKRKHSGTGVKFVLADAENTMEPDGTYDALVCRHLVWTLTDPDRAVSDWFRVLKPGGKLLIFDGNWAKKTLLGQLASLGIICLEQFIGHDPYYDGVMSEKHAGIMARLPFSNGLTAEKLTSVLGRAGYERIRFLPHKPIAVAQRRNASLRNRLRTLFYQRFVVVAERPLAN